MASAGERKAPGVPSAGRSQSSPAAPTARGPECATLGRRLIAPSWQRTLCVGRTGSPKVVGTQNLGRAEPEPTNRISACRDVSAGVRYQCPSGPPLSPKQGADARALRRKAGPIDRYAWCPLRLKWGGSHRGPGRVGRSRFLQERTSRPHVANIAPSACCCPSLERTASFSRKYSRTWSIASRRSAAVRL
jgi:hypothetical protein